MNYKKGNYFPYFYILSTTINLANVFTQEVVAELITAERFCWGNNMKFRPPLRGVLLIPLSRRQGPTKKI